MNPFLAAVFVVAFAQESREAFYAVPIAELEFEQGSLLPQYGGYPPWQWGEREWKRPRAVLAGEGEVVFVTHEEAASAFDGDDPLGALVLRTAEARDVAGTLFVPKASGEGFLRLEFRVPAARATATESQFLTAELAHYAQLLRAGVPGGAWFRHRHDELSAALGAAAPDLADARAFSSPLRDPDDAYALFSGGRAVYENLQLERGLPAGDGAGATIPLDTLEGITVRAYDWKARLAATPARFDTLAWLVPEDQHALFFRHFQGLVDTLDEAARLGEFGLNTAEGRSSDAGTRARYETQLCLTLDEVARAFGPLAIESAALTGSDPYLRAGSDVALLLEVRPEFRERVVALIEARQAASGVELAAGPEGLGQLARSPTRRVSSHLFALPSTQGALPPDFPAGNVLVITNSPVQSARLLDVAQGREPSLAASDEYVFFRQRYALGGESESALLVLPDAAIRRWCSPRWRIAAARRTHAAAALAEETARHLAELVRGNAAGNVAARTLGPSADFPDLDTLSLSDEGVHSSRYGNLAFQTPLAELELAKVSEREAGFYRLWREGYQQAWSNFFDPIAARVSITPEGIALDLTVMPLILGTRYDSLREVTRGPGLGPDGGDLHDSALVHFAMGIDREWEPLRSLGMSLGSAGQKLGPDPLGWLGSWLSVYLDDGPFWDELEQAESPQEFLDFDENLNEIPLAVTIAVESPLELALFLSALRAFVDGTAPGLTEWKERNVGERRFVQIGSRGMGADVKLFYGTPPGRLVLSLHEETLLAAMARAEAAAAQVSETAKAPPATKVSAATTVPPANLPPPDAEPPVHAALELRGRGLEALDLLLVDEFRRTLLRGSFGNLAILSEWKQLFPAEDPLELHARIFHERLTCPGGGAYAWDDEWRTFASSVFGHPGKPASGVSRPPAWEDVERLRSRLTFEEDGLRVRLELERE